MQLPPRSWSFSRVSAVQWALCLVLVVVAVHANGVAGAFLLDDEPTILRNPSIRNLGSLGQVLWPPLTVGTVARPLSNLSYAIDHAVWGYWGPGYHLTNLVLHGAVALLAFGVGRRVVRRCRGERAIASESTAAVGGVALWVAVWAVHPLNTATVAFLTARTELLASFFGLLTLYSFVRYAEGAHRAWASASVAACLAGVLSKELVVVFPLLVLLLDRSAYAGSFGRALASRRVLYLGYGLAWVVLAAVILTSGGSRGGTSGFGTLVSPWHYLLTQCRGIGTYLQLALWPDALCFDYGRAIVRDLWKVLPQAVLLCSLFAASVVGLWRRAWWGLLGAWFFLILAPSSSFVPLATQTVAEHRMYLPLLAVVAAAGLLLRRFRWWWLAPLGLIPVLGVLTVRRNALFAEPIALWSDTVAKQPGNARARNNLGNALVAAGRHAEALAQYDAGLAAMKGKDADLLGNRATVLSLLHRLDEAEAAARAGVALEPKNTRVRVILGHVLWGHGKAEEAEAVYRQVLHDAPGEAGAEFGLGSIAMAAGKYEEAIDRFSRSLATYPLSAQVVNNLASAYLRLGRQGEALSYFGEAVRLDPMFGRARANRAAMLAQAGRLEEAIPEFEEAARLLPDDVETRMNLALAYELTGAPAAARRHYEEVLRLQHDNQGARQRLALLKHEDDGARPPKP